MVSCNRQGLNKRKADRGRAQLQARPQPRPAGSRNTGHIACISPWAERSMPRVLNSRTRGVAPHCPPVLDLHGFKASLL